jgi:hypothetical protein
MASDDWKLPWKGACLCGAVEMLVSQPPVGSMACHCKGCQKLTSGPYSLSLLIPESGFAVTQGEPVLGGLHAEHRQFYCAHCKSWIFTRPAGVPFVNFRVTMLEDARWFRPIMETGTADRLAFAETGAEFSFAGFPDPADYLPIMQAFADHGARPVK